MHAQQQQQRQLMSKNDKKILIATFTSLCVCTIFIKVVFLPPFSPFPFTIHYPSSTRPGH